MTGPQLAAPSFSPLPPLSNTRPTNWLTGVDLHGRADPLVPPPPSAVEQLAGWLATSPTLPSLPWTSSRRGGPLPRPAQADDRRTTGPGLPPASFLADQPRPTNWLTSTGGGRGEVAATAPALPSVLPTPRTRTRRPTGLPGRVSCPVLPRPVSLLSPARNPPSAPTLPRPTGCTRDAVPPVPSSSLPQVGRRPTGRAGLPLPVPVRAPHRPTDRPTDQLAGDGPCPFGRSLPPSLLSHRPPLPSPPPPDLSNNWLQPGRTSPLSPSLPLAPTLAVKVPGRPDRPDQLVLSRSLPFSLSVLPLSWPPDQLAPQASLPDHLP